MKTPNEFKADVYAKRDARLRQGARVKRSCALLCVFLAVFVLGGTLIFRQRIIPLAPGETEQRRSKQEGIRSLYVQAANPQPPEDLCAIPLLEAESQEWESQKSYASGSGRAQDNAASDQTEDPWEHRGKMLEGTMLDEAFPLAVNTLAKNTGAALSEKMEENACYSPLSLYYALALTGTGASGETEREFLDALSAPDRDWLGDQCNKFYRQNYRKNDYVKFLLANSLWIQRDFPFEEDYVNRAEKDYFSSLFQADFAAPGIGDAISGWISDNTDGLLSPKLEFSGDERIAIVNTVYLKDGWSDRFSEENNTVEPFTKKDGSQMDATFMHRTEMGAAVYFGEGFTRASLSLQDTGEIVFILPDEGVSPKKLLSDPQAFEDMFFQKSSEEQEFREIHWSVPRFSFDADYDLLDVLPKLGLETAVDPGKADFSAMSSTPLYLTKALQGVHVGLDEEGVEAAAYTLMAAAEGAPVQEEKPPVEMNLNRPFLFAIVSDDRLESQKDEWNMGQTLLFVGICGEPETAD